MKKEEVYEIEFRGIPHPTEECCVVPMDIYIHGGIQTIPWSDKAFICINDPITHKWKHVRIMPESIGQKTGLVTNKMKKLYTGDIISSPKGNRHVVRYNKFEARYVAELIPYRDENSYCGITQHWLTKFNKEIIGTEYNDPELME